MRPDEAIIRRTLETIRRPHPDQHVIDAACAWLLRVTRRTQASRESPPTSGAAEGSTPCAFRDE